MKWNLLTIEVRSVEREQSAHQSSYVLSLFYFWVLLGARKRSVTALALSLSLSLSYASIYFLLVYMFTILSIYCPFTVNMLCRRPTSNREKTWCISQNTSPSRLSKTGTCVSLPLIMCNGWERWWSTRLLSVKLSDCWKQMVEKKGKGGEREPSQKIVKWTECVSCRFVHLFFFFS